MFRLELVERVLDVLDRGDESDYLNESCEYMQDTHYSMLYQMFVLDVLIPELGIDNPDWNVQTGDWVINKEDLLVYVCGKFRPDQEEEFLKDWMKSCSQITLTGNLHQAEEFLGHLQQLQQHHFAVIAGQTLDLLFKEGEV